MTDDEIIKALECIAGNGQPCEECLSCTLFLKNCQAKCAKSVLDLINRQREKLNKYPIKTIVGNNCEIHSKTSKDYDNLMADIKSEAIKEFAERLKGKIWYRPECQYVGSITPDYVDNLVKEMMEVEE